MIAHGASSARSRPAASAFPESATAAEFARPSRLRPPEDFGLPRGYVQQTEAFTRDHAVADVPAAAPAEEYWNPQRIAASARWQWHVYAWGARLVRSRSLRSVLDVGCGPATKLAALIAPVCDDIEGIDQPSAVAAAEQLGRPGRFRAVDLDAPHTDNRSPAPRTYDLIICADVLEHLLDPDPALRFIGSLCHAGSLVLLSTPDRDRLRGRRCMRCEKIEHVREWSAAEFAQYLRSRGWVVLQTRMLPADDAPYLRGVLRELLFQLRLAPTSPHRCTTVLCRPAAQPPVP